MNGQYETQTGGSTHTLGLPSWYPSHEQDHNGLFCLAQLDALAAAGHRVGVIAAVPLGPAKVSAYVCIHQHTFGPACVAHYRPGHLLPLQALRYCRAMYKAWRLYRSTFGRPRHVLVMVAWKAGLFARWLHWRHNIPYHIIEHWSLYITDNMLYIPVYLKFLFKYIYSGARSVAAVGLPLARALQTHFPGIQKAAIIPNVVDTTLFRPRSTEPAAATESLHRPPLIAPDALPLLIHVSNLAEVKNFAFALRVFEAFRARYPDARFWVAGAFNPGEAKSRYPIPPVGVEWAGFVDAPTLAAQFRRATALLLPSHHETFSIVTAEAMACGCPVLSSPLPALDAFIPFGTLERLPATDPEAWAGVLERWTEKRPAMPQGAWEGIHRAYGKEAVGNIINKWLQTN